MKREALDKLEAFIIAGADKAIAEGDTIVCGQFRPSGTSCCPIYAACKEERSKGKSQITWDLPLYEDIISKQIGETFTSKDVTTFTHGFDYDHPFTHSSFMSHPDRDESVFNLARRIRGKYIMSPVSVVPDYKENTQNVQCMTDVAIAHYAKTRELPNVMFGHLHTCQPCRVNLEAATLQKTEEPTLTFWQQFRQLLRSALLRLAWA